MTMIDHASKDYLSQSQKLVNKVKMGAFVALCFMTFAGILATTCEVGHSLQMARINEIQSQGH
jgi:hypothetical protein